MYGATTELHHIKLRGLQKMDFKLNKSYLLNSRHCFLLKVQKKVVVLESEYVEIATDDKRTAGYLILYE